MNNIRILMVVLMTISLSITSLQAIAFTDCNTKISSEATLDDSVLISSKFPAPRELIPPSLKERFNTKETGFSKQLKSLSDCNTTTMCSSFDVNTTPEKVSAWMGFNLDNVTGNYFVATYGQEATHLGNNIYSTPIWDKKHFWIKIGEKTVPFPIQPRFALLDQETGYEWYVVDYIGFQKADINYTNYPDNLSLSSLVMLVNPSTKNVEQYYLEYYDENDEYSGTYEIEIGDKVQATFLAFKKDVKDVDYLVSIEGLTPVTSPITFEYKEQYPGIDFNCSFCGGLDFSKVELQYIFEEFSQQRSTFTEPQEIFEKSTIDSSVSNSKSVSISGFWIFFFLTFAIAFIVFKYERRYNKV